MLKPYNTTLLKAMPVTGKTTKQYFADLVPFIDERVTDTNVLDGLGELLADQQKDHTNATLERDILFDLRSRI